MTNRIGRWVFASGNKGKYAELKALLTPTGIALVARSEFDLASPEETGRTFLENALLKARHAAAATGLPAIADDSGLAVDALGGAPGVRSARFADGGGAQANIAKLLGLMEDVPDPDRGARFCCVVVAMTRWDDPMPLVGSGQWHGQIAQKPSGESGFGYDPVFFDPRLGATAAELPAEVKNRVSHRGQALAQIEKALRGRVARGRVACERAGDD